MYPGKRKSPAEYSYRNRVKLVNGGKEYFDLLIKLINNAKDHVHLQTYIYDDDETGEMVAQALLAAAARNVQVYLLADGYASKNLSPAFIDKLKQGGVRFRYFEPLIKSKYFYFGRRMHHKILVVDARHAVIGGTNVSNRYNDIGNVRAWLDMAVYVEGEVARELCILCWKTWKSFPINMGITPCEEIDLHYHIKPRETCGIRIRRNDWVRRKNEISASYVEMIRFAQSHITILCSYFLPGKVIRRLLSDASKRGVEITVIATGPTDVILSKWAERWLYDWLLRRNIKLYEYQPTVLHAKVAVSDGKILSIGSYNVNDISAYASIELNLDIKSPDLAQHLEVFIDQIIKNDCKLISKEEHVKTKNIFKQFIRWLSYRLIRIIFHLLTFYYKQHN
jgi:cardiolipin synthase A/B